MYSQPAPHQRAVRARRGDDVHAGRCLRVGATRRSSGRRDVRMFMKLLTRLVNIRRNAAFRCAPYHMRELEPPPLPFSSFITRVAPHTVVKTR